MEAKEYLNSVLSQRKEVDDWLAGKTFSFSKYDSELGYLFHNVRYKKSL